jgi:hypothetical protein
MTTIRYFEIKVTNCMDCPYADPIWQQCKQAPRDYAGAWYDANRYELNTLCPMSKEHKDEESK